MNDYGKGIVQSATILPATSATGILLSGSVHPIVIAGFLIINAVWFLILIAHISRYFINRTR